jgi:hypothetical protein
MQIEMTHILILFITDFSPVIYHIENENVFCGRPENRLKNLSSA